MEEAQALREAGFEDEELLMLRATVDREELERLVDLIKEYGRWVDPK